MIKRPNPYANISLAAPTIPTADFGVPNMQFSAMTPLPTPPVEGADTGGQLAGLGASLLNMKKRFGAQSGAIKSALGGVSDIGKVGGY